MRTSHLLRTSLLLRTLLAALRERPGSHGWLLGLLLGALVLAPALRLPGGILSPAATLAEHAPWQGTTDASQGNPVLRDVTFQIQPFLLHLRAELRAGRLPQWNPYQGAGTPFWANGQSAPLFPLHLLFVALPLRLAWLALPWLRLATAAAGTFALARGLGLGAPAASLAGATFALGGMQVGFLLYPLGGALALLPWVLLAVERLASGSGTWRGLAVAAGLQLLAGHPETSAHTALLATLYLLVRRGLRAPRPWGDFLAGWLLAAALAAVHLLPFLANLPHTSRWQQWSSLVGEPPALGLLLLQPLRLVLPEMYGNPAHGTWWGPFNYLALAVYCGALPIALAVAGSLRAATDRRWRAVLAVFALAAFGGYHLPVVRDLLAALPFIGRALHHRLVMGIELGVALLAAAGLESWLRGRARALWAGAALLGLLLAAAWMALGDDWAARGASGLQARWSAWAAAMALLAAGAVAVPPLARRRLAWLPLVLVVADLLAAHGAVNPPLPLARLYPPAPAVRFLQGQPGRVAGLGTALHPNAATVYRLRDVRLDDTVKAMRYEAINAQLGAAHPTYFRPLADWGSPWLDRLSLRWVLAPPGAAPPQAGWRVAYAGADATVFERPGALPMARWAAASPGSELRAMARLPGYWRLHFRTRSPAVVVVAEMWDRGWSATAAGRAVRPGRAHDALLAVPVAAGEGEIVLRYRAPGLVAGAAVTAAALLLLAAAYRPRMRSRSTSSNI